MINNYLYVYNNSHPSLVVTPWMDDCVIVVLDGEQSNLSTAWMSTL